jgi:PAS domain S-box-containing protein
MNVKDLQALVESEAKFRQFADNAEVVFWVCEPDVSKFHYISPGYEKIWSRSCADVYSNPRSFLESVHPDDLERVVAAATGVQACHMNEDYRIIRADGQVRWVNDRTFPVYDEQGKLSRMVGIAYDITDRKKTELYLHDTEAKFYQFANNADIVFWVCEPDASKFYYISPGYEKIWGRSCESIYENPRSFLESVHPDDFERVFAAATGENACNMNEDYRIIRTNGQVRWVNDRTFPVYDERGNVYRMAGIAEDITYRKLAEAEVLKTLQRERELSDAKSSFIATTSHEIRTPLATIQSSLDMLQHYTDRLNEDKKQGHFQKIENAVQRIKQIVQDTLLLSEGEAGTLQFEPKLVDVVQLCKGILEGITDNKNRIEFETNSNTTQVDLDSKLISYIINNLLENALKYSPQNTTVKFDLNCTESAVIFSIQDQGIGIPEENLPHIFDSFYRANNVEMSSGTGLGLAIVKQCVDLHKGEIEVISKVDEGTTFTITLRMAVRS